MNDYYQPQLRALIEQKYGAEQFASDVAKRLRPTASERFYRELELPEGVDAGDLMLLTMRLCWVDVLALILKRVGTHTLLRSALTCLVAPLFVNAFECEEYRDEKLATVDFFLKNEEFKAMLEGWDDGCASHFIRCLKGWVNKRRGIWESVVEHTRSRLGSGFFLRLLHGVDLSTDPIYEVLRDKALVPRHDPHFIDFLIVYSRNCESGHLCAGLIDHPDTRERLLRHDRGFGVFRRYDDELACVEWLRRRLAIEGIENWPLMLYSAFESGAARQINVAVAIAITSACHPMRRAFYLLLRHFTPMLFDELYDAQPQLAKILYNSAFCSSVLKFEPDRTLNLAILLAHTRVYDDALISGDITIVERPDASQYGAEAWRQRELETQRAAAVVFCVGDVLDSVARGHSSPMMLGAGFDSLGWLADSEPVETMAILCHATRPALVAFYHWMEIELSKDALLSSMLSVTGLAKLQAPADDDALREVLFRMLYGLGDGPRVQFADGEFSEVRAAMALTHALLKEARAMVAREFWIAQWRAKCAELGLGLAALRLPVLLVTHIYDELAPRLVEEFVPMQFKWDVLKLFRDRVNVH